MHVRVRWPSRDPSSMNAVPPVDLPRCHHMSAEYVVSPGRLHLAQVLSEALMDVTEGTIVMDVILDLSEPQES